jgi:peptidoglycan/LPS O-acetylase OafA/YrhL
VERFSDIAVLESAQVNRIRSLDGLRAISILLVFVGHYYELSRQAAPSGPLWLIIGNAGLGVTIFFVISAT